MRLSRLLEVVSGILTSLVGVGMLVYLVAVPVYRGIGCVTLPGQPPDCTATFATLLNGADPGTRLEVALVAVLLVAVGVAATWHARTGLPGARVVLWIAAGALSLWTICPFLLPGVHMLPSVGLALVACLAAILREPEEQLGNASR